MFMLNPSMWRTRNDVIKVMVGWVGLQPGGEEFSIEIFPICW